MPPNCIINRIKIRAVWRPVFRFKELRHIWAQVSNSVAWTMCRRSVLLKQIGEHCSRWCIVAKFQTLTSWNIWTNSLGNWQLYVSVNWVTSMCSGHICHNFSCCDDLSKFGKEYLNSLKCQFCTFFSIKLRKFWHTVRLSRTNRHKVIKSEKQSGFLAHPVFDCHNVAARLLWRYLYKETSHFTAWFCNLRNHCEITSTPADTLTPKYCWNFNTALYALWGIVAQPIYKHFYQCRHDTSKRGQTYVQKNIHPC